MSGNIEAMDLGDAIAAAVIKQFNTLPRKSKPAVRSNGVPTWTPLSGIVVSFSEDFEVRCLALGTGMRCLPAAKVLVSKGYVLRDWHAEILAIRAFNQFLLEECLHLAKSSDYTSTIVQWRDSSLNGESQDQPFLIREGVKLHMYSSEAPCGDASMELVMEAQEDATPWSVDACASNDKPFGMLGRGNFSELGIVRRKPARRDSPPTLSKSCSDKLALKQCTSLLNRDTCRFISPENAYISTLVLPRSQYNETACQRAFGPDGRMESVVGKQWAGRYRFQPFAILTSDSEFEFCRRRLLAAPKAPKGSNISAVWNTYIEETLVNGVLQGHKQIDPRGVSALSEIKMWELASKVGEEIGRFREESASIEVPFNIEPLVDRGIVKKEVWSSALKGWIRNERGLF